MKRNAKPLQKGLIRFFLILYSIIVIFPVLWAISTSFKTNQEFFKDAWALPEALRFSNYAEAWVVANLGDNFLNSVLLTFSTVILLSLLAAMAGYAATRLATKRGSLLTYLFMAGMFVPTILGVIPTYFVLWKIKLLNSMIGLGLVYLAYGSPFSVFVVSGFIKTIPHELEDSGLMDGCSYYQIFTRIILPLSRPSLVTVGIFNFIAFWNEYVFALTYVTDPSKKTLAVGLVSLLSTAQYQTKWGVLFAGLTIVMVPTMIVYAIFQNKITGGLTVGALKG